jgi:anti-sigma B factor antagonist
MVKRLGCRGSAGNAAAQAVGASGAPEPAPAARSDDFGQKTVFSPVAAGRRPVLAAAKVAARADDCGRPGDRRAADSRPHGKPPTDRLGCMVSGSISPGFRFEGRMTTHRRIDVAKTGDVSVVKFQDRKILDEASIQELGLELFALVELENRKSILLNFTGVEFLSSAALGKLITLDRKVKSHKGRLKLCNIRPEILEVFQITKLNKVFDIRTEEAEAIAAFA